MCRYLSEILISVLLDTYPDMGLFGHMVVLFVVFLRNLHPVFFISCTILHSFTEHLLFCLFIFYNGHPNRCEVMYFKYNNLELVTYKSMGVIHLGYICVFTSNIFCYC